MVISFSKFLDANTDIYEVLGVHISSWHSYIHASGSIAYDGEYRYQFGIVRFRHLGVLDLEYAITSQGTPL